MQDFPLFCLCNSLLRGIQKLHFYHLDYDEKGSLIFYDK